MHFLPILSTLRRHRTAATLIVLEIALTCAIVCNAIFVISDRLDRMNVESGVAEDELIRIQIAGIGKDLDGKALTAQDLTALRGIPGVKSAATVNMVPFGGSSWNSDLSTIPDDPSGLNVGLYLGSKDLIKTLGVQLTSGRDFLPGEYVEFEDVQKGTARMPATIITQAVADRYFPGQDALGKQLYAWGKEPQTVIGIVDRIARPNQFGNNTAVYNAVIVPIDASYTVAGNYVVRVEPGQQATVLAAVDATLNKVNASRIIHERQTFGEIRTKFFRQDRAMALLLVGVTLALLIITALGVVGLASFWVQQRTRQIGIRRALGATRRDIVHYFQLENFILATLGIVLGMALAYAINLWLMDKYHVPRLPAVYLPIGALLLWGLGQIAVLGPALRAALIPPAIATRSV